MMVKVLIAGIVGFLQGFFAIHAIFVLPRVSMWLITMRDAKPRPAVRIIFTTLLSFAYVIANVGLTLAFASAPPPTHRAGGVWAMLLFTGMVSYLIVWPGNVQRFDPRGRR